MSTFRKRLEELRGLEKVAWAYRPPFDAGFMAGARAALLDAAFEAESSATYWELKSPGCAHARVCRAEAKSLRARAEELKP